MTSEKTGLVTKSGSDAADLEVAGEISASTKGGFASKHFLYRDAPIEATGCAIDSYARATIFMSRLFVGPALLKLASHSAIHNAGCIAEDEDYEACVEASKIYGFKASSLLTNMGSIAGMISIVSLPLFGAVVDFTPYRKQIGMFTAMGVVLIKFFELGLGPNTWFFVVCLQVVSSILYETHMATMESYSAELSHESKEQSRYQSMFSALIFASMFLYLLEVLMPSVVMHLNDIQTARWAILVAVINSAPLFTVGWMNFFRDRPPASKLSNGQTILTAGFQKLVITFKEISSKYKPVKHFLIYCVGWSEAAIAALPVIATTYMSDYLEMNSQQIGAVLLMTMIGGMPGAFVGNYFCWLFNNPIRSVQLCLITFTINTILAGLFLRPSTRDWMFGFAFVWGICEGWIRPQHTTIFVTIVPIKDGAVELMALFIFFRQILSFLPPLVFTILNESGMPMSIGISSLVIYSILGFVGLLCMADYDTARSLVL